MRFRHFTAAIAAWLALSACVSNPSQKTLSEVRSQANPADRSSRAVTNFTPALRCMDEMLFNQGVRDITLMMEEFRDITQKLPISTRDMMTSAVSDMTRRSRAVRLSVFGSDQQNLTQFLQQAQKQSAFAVVPQYSLRGNISQLDDSVEKRGAAVGLSLAERLFGVRFGTETKFSVMGFDAALVETESMTLLPGVSSKNLTVLTSRDASAADGEAKLTNPGLDVVFSFSASRSEGTAQAARNMVELAAVELVGKLVRLPYWQCVNVSDTDPEVQREMEDWFLSMEAQELHSFLQERMRERRYFDGAIDGQPSDAFDSALASYRQAIGLPPVGLLDLAFFKRFIVMPVPRGPLAALPRKARVAATTTTPDSALTTAAATAVPEPVSAPAPAPASASASASAPAPAPEPAALQISVLAAPVASKKGLGLQIAASRSGYLYCYSQDPVSQKIVRIFPNRFVRDPRIEASQPIRLPAGQRFVLNPAAQYACLHAPLEVYGDLPAPLRWGDFEEIRLKSFDEIRDHFSQISGAAITLQRLNR